MTTAPVRGSGPAYLGVGLAFPVVPVTGGSLALVAGDEAVRQSITAILVTEPGERVMRPGFGCGLRRYLMRPNDATTRAEIKRDVELSLAAWEPRIRLRSVDVVLGDDPEVVLVGVAYTHVRDGRPGNLVHSFPLR